ncbi:MAG TPA: iron dependent repressor, metal binding and dimerization domain protein [Anaerolineae bacterium]|nr:iron dependent repressor, metal binding and dimerization domain protein [Anaerolineae bacterium]
MIDPLIALLIAGLLAGITVLLFWPERGLVIRWRRSRQISERVLAEDALKHIHEHEMKGQPATLESVAGTLHISRDQAAQLLERAEENGLVSMDAGMLHLTPDGRNAALHIIRAHRLWERYLADQTGYDEAQWHGQADRIEHSLQPADADALAASLGNPTHDPHGDPIPDATGQFVAHGGQPLTAIALDHPAQIVHIEDEPETIYAQLVALGLYPGMTVRLIEATPKRVRFWANGDEHVLAPILATNISVVPLPQTVAVAVEDDSETLADLKLGERGEVKAILPRCRGAERRRFMDLGILPGTVIAAEMISAGGDPTAYRIREALIALRSEQARMIQITRHTETAA